MREWKEVMKHKSDLCDDCANCLDYIYDELIDNLTTEDGINVVTRQYIDVLFKNMRRLGTGLSSSKQLKDPDICSHSRVCRFRFVGDPDCKNVECSSFMRK